MICAKRVGGRRALLGRWAIGWVAVAALAVLPGAGQGGATPPPPAPAPVATDLADWEVVVARLEAQARGWFASTPGLARVGWAGVVACAILGALSLVGRLVRTRPSAVIPRAFVGRFQRRLEAGELDAGKALDYCELNPSPAARVALAAVRRWGRPVLDQERAVSLAVRVESERLRHNLGTLRRVAALAPLVGLLGTLGDLQAKLAAVAPGTAWGPAVAAALGPLTAAVALAIVALVAFDGLSARVEGLVERLDRIGAETIDGMTQASAAVTLAPAPPPSVSRAVPRPHLADEPSASARPSRRPAARDEGRGRAV
jgi:biopolymer transport protein ExbB